MRNYTHAFALLLASAAVCPAASVTVTAVDSGAYSSAGAHTPGNQNYITGTFTTERRSFFAFDLSSVAGTVNSAKLRLFNPEVSAFLHGYSSPDPTETLNIYDVTTPAANIIDSTAGVAGFNDLGSGTLFGTQTVSAADNGFVVEIVLNADAIAALNARGSGLFVFGGALSTISGPGDQHVFGFSMTPFVDTKTRELVLDVTAVPEPSTIGLMLAAVALTGAARLRFARKIR